MSANITSPDFNPELCTLHTCPIQYAQIGYVPTLAGNSLYLAIFALLLFFQVLIGIRYRNWGYLASLVGGLILEIIGYAARIQMHFNPFLANPFLIYLICLTIAPVFLTAAIYLCLARIIVVHDTQYARFAPRTYTIIFICCDVFSLVLQAAGGAIADTSGNNPSLGQTGINIMIAGLSFQVASLTLFAALCGDFAWRVYKHRDYLTPLRTSASKSKLHFFYCALMLATITIYVRSCYRVAELQGGFGGPLANEEIPFMILEGAVIVIGSLALTAAHPGPIFGRSWGEASITRKDETQEKA